MICKECGSENEESVAVCAQCGDDLTGKEKNNTTPQKVRTNLVLNIFYVFLSLPFLWGAVRMSIDLMTFNHGSFLILKVGLPLLFFFTTGITLAVRAGRHVKSIAASGDYEGARKAALTSRTWFARFFAFSVVFGILVAIALPGTLSYKERGLDLLAKEKLKELISLQDKISKNKGVYFSKLEDIEGWTGSEIVDVKILEANNKCWKGSAVHKEGRNVIIYDHCGGVGEVRFTKVRR